MHEFDDPELSQRLGRLSGPLPDESSALTQVRHRVVRARRRRAAAWVAGSGAVMVLVVAAYATGLRDGDDSLRPATNGGTFDGTGTLDSSGTPAPGSTDVESSTSLDEPSTSTVSSTVPTVSTNAGQAIGSTTTTVRSGSQPGTSTSVPASAPTSSSPASTTPTTATSEPTTTASSGPVTKTYSGIGGSITVRLQNGTLTLLNASPASGFTITERREDPDRIEVRFVSTDHSTKVRVDLLAGQMSPYVEEEVT